LAHAPYVVADLHALGALGAHAGPRRVMTHLLAALLARLPATRAAFLLRQDQRTVLFAVQRAGQPAPDFPELALEDGEAAQAPLAFVRLALQQGRTVRVTVAEAAALAGSDPYFLAQGPAAILCTPLAAHGHTVALLLLEQAQGARAATAASGESSVAVDGFEAADALYVELLGATAALLVENSHLRRRLVDATGARGTAGADPSAWLLGTMRVVHGGQEITPQLQGRVRDLVALLLLQPADMPITRAEIAAAFWPDTAEAQSLTNVRNLLHKLRTAWPDAASLLEFGRQQIQWKPDVGAWIDVHVFRRGLAEATRLDAGAAVHLLRASVALYNGSLLPGANDEWVQPLRERLHGQYLEALSRLAGLLIDQHDFAGALHYARLLLSADPLREESYRHLLRAQALAGDPAAAQQTYAACAAMLAAEFGASPSPATEAIYRQYITQA
jgi:DNA-binding SARP family transcriptional activator